MPCFEQGKCCRHTSRTAAEHGDLGGRGLGFWGGHLSSDLKELGMIDV
jgi:hypothetical protein